MNHSSISIIISGLSEEAFDYMESCARIRRISCTRLMERVLKKVCDDQLMLAVLDDDSKQPPNLPGENTNSHFRKQHEKEKL